MAALSKTGAAGLAAAAGLIALRVLVGASFARHASRVVFNRALPPRAAALRRMLAVTRPLGIVWRLLTARLRCVPDVYILGEVRCGTTTAASLLRSKLGMEGPFTPWVHPLADDKESFYLVGHFWGFVSPALYPMVFPLRLRRWLHRAVRGRRLFVFEGCASYLSAPWAPALVKAVTPRPVLVVCLREPVAQHVSWWQLEQGGMAWGSAMGLGHDWLAPPTRLPGYPPLSLRAAVDRSRSAEVASLYERAAALPLGCSSDASLLHRLLPATLPGWATPFPDGQLSAFDHMGRYADSIERWRSHFGDECFVFVHLEDLARDPEAFLAAVGRACERLHAEAPRRQPATAAATAPKLNASAALPEALRPDEATLRELAEYYRPHNERLFKLLGRDLGWHDDQKAYPYYHA